jgi:arylsulfatase A-like enzyme
MPTLADLTETSAELSGLRLDGQSVWPLLTGSKNQATKDRVFYWQGVKKEAAALRQGKWKLIVDRVSDSRQLFNLEKDPSEETDLASGQKDRVERMLELLHQEQAKDNDALPGNSPQKTIN